MIVGIDEVGRGAWAGPMAVGAVLLGGASIEGLTDSKKLTKKQRERLDIEIRQKALAIGIGWVSARTIDEIGLSAALKLAAMRALAHIRGDYKEIIIDGTIRLVDDPRVTLMAKADLLVPSVSAASIVAKVARDNYMKHIDKVFPGYKFGSHVGYGTASHRAAIQEKGVSPIHRLSYAPLKQYQATPRIAPAPSVRTTKQIGDTAEKVVEAHLASVGHVILARNWRTKYCEIDIVSRLGDTVYFTEVKYRKTDNQGGGLAAITAKKQRQMAFAAEFYATKNNMSATDMRLAAADVAGRVPTLKTFLELG
ncbi:MAG: ribonuclease HII [Candidatus Saccharibacteria bacterium]|nr:MAG: ribonuclease HII [Candidatus Saccharibacteria bacterium]